MKRIMLLALLPIAGPALADGKAPRPTVAQMLDAGVRVDQRLAAHVTQQRVDVAHADKLLHASNEAVKDQVKILLSPNPNQAAMDTLRDMAKDALTARLTSGGTPTPVAKLVAGRLVGGGI